MEWSCEIDRIAESLQKAVTEACEKAETPAHTTAVREKLQQLQKRLRQLEELCVYSHHNTPEQPQEAAQLKVMGETLIQGESMKEVLSLNDRFRFAAELFGGNEIHMAEVLRQMAEMSSVSAALLVLRARTVANAAPETLQEFEELVRKTFPDLRL